MNNHAFQQKREYNQSICGSRIAYNYVLVLSYIGFEMAMKDHAAIVGALFGIEIVSLTTVLLIGRIIS